uniref:Uncharacterized protein n=1 Tax=Rhizophora mucronata TaxID=61149 RepID=A0A2P2PVA1_RHIMU
MASTLTTQTKYIFSQDQCNTNVVSRLGKRS